MSRKSFILFIGRPEWHLAIADREDCDWLEVPYVDGQDLQTQTSQLLSLLTAQGYASDPILLAIPSSWCLAARIKTDDLPRNDRKAMLFRLEEQLPLAAEKIIADFIFFEAAFSGDDVLAVCVKIDLLSPIVAAVEGAGIAVMSIVPAVILAAQVLVERAQAQPAVLLIAEPDDADLDTSVLALQGGRLLDWSLAPSNADDIALQVNLLFTEFDSVPKLLAAGASEELLESVTAKTSHLISVLAEDPADSAAEMAISVLSGRTQPWIEFRRDQLAIDDPLRLHRKPMNALLAAAIVLCLSVATVVYLRSVRYSQIEQSCNQQMINDFRQNFPGWAIPMNVKAIIESQHRQAAAVASAPDSSTGSALTTMHDLLLRLPLGQYSLDRMSFTGDSFEFSGKLQSYEQADTLASAARGAGMQVSPPQTRKDNQEFWTFLIDGVRPGKTAVASAQNK